MVRRLASSTEFAMSKAQALGTALFVSWAPARADFVDAFLLLITIFIAILLATVLWMPWTRGVTSRTVLHDQGTQAEEPSSYRSTQTSQLGDTLDRPMRSFLISLPRPVDLMGLQKVRRLVRPDNLLVHVTGAGDAWHVSHKCAARTRNRTRSFRPCHVCPTIYTFPQLLESTR